MRAFPAGIDQALESYANVVLRTDFSDEQGWLAVVEAVKLPPQDWVDDDYEVNNFVVDDPSWDGATPDQILEVIHQNEHLAGYLSLVMVADKEAVSGDEHPLLVVTAYSPQDELYEEVTEFGREFRCLPRETHQISVNVGLANMDFEEFSQVASASPDGIFRGWK